jgi:hypothetical protein
MALHRIIPIHWGPREYLAIGCHSPSFTKALPEGQKVLQPLEVRALLQSLAQIEPEVLAALYLTFGERRGAHVRDVNLVRELCELAGVGEGHFFGPALGAKFMIVALPRPAFAPPPERYNPNKERDEILDRAFTRAADWIEIVVYNEDNVSLASLGGDAVLSSGEARRIITDGRGHHRIDPLPTGECEYWFKYNGKGEGLAANVGSGMDRYLQGLFEPAANWIEIVVFNEDEMALASLVGETVLPSGDVRRIVTDGGGHHRIEALPKGECEYRLKYGGKTAGSSLDAGTVVERSADADPSMRSDEIAIVLVDEDEVAMPAVAGAITTSSGGKVDFVTDANGEYRVEHLVTGNCDIRFVITGSPQRAGLG